MEYVYAALLLHKAGKPVDAGSITKVMQASGAEVDESKVKSLVASLSGVDIEAELANAINEEIARAVAQGIDEAAVTAGWEAYFEVLAAGGTAAEASAKAYETCGSACDNY